MGNTWAPKASPEDDMIGTWALEASPEDDKKGSGTGRPSSRTTLLKYCNICNLSKHTTIGSRVRRRGGERSEGGG
jgi:hypothetical protein